MKNRLGFREKSIPCAVVLAGLCLATSPVALAKDTRPVAAAAPPAAAPPAPVPPAPVPPAPVPPAPVPPALAPPPSGCACSPPGSHDGFYTRLAVGLGLASASGAGTKYSGGSFVLDAAVGGALTEHLILYGELLFHSIPGPKGKPKVGDPTLVGNPVDNIGLGPGLAYYFMPWNFYLSGSLLFQKVLLTKTSVVVAPAVAVSSKQFTKTGLGFNLMVGKEWWVSDNWGLGVALQLLLAGAKDRDGTEWDSGALAVLFTASHN
jgi:hypothetical protein